jgi:hypothetical protein
MEEYAENYLNTHKESSSDTENEKDTRLRVISHLFGVAHEIQSRK